MSEELAGPLDETVLRSIQVQLNGDRRFGDVEFKPSIDNLRKVSATYDPVAYPPQIVSTRLDIRWTTVGDFSIHYVEKWEQDDRWECQWINIRKTLADNISIRHQMRERQIQRNSPWTTEV
jgi:hypothetical protein